MLLYWKRQTALGFFRNYLREWGRAVDYVSRAPRPRWEGTRCSQTSVGKSFGEARIRRASPRGPYRRSLYPQGRGTYFHRTCRPAWADAWCMWIAWDSFRGLAWSNYILPLFGPVFDVHLAGVAARFSAATPPIWTCCLG